MLVVNGSNNWPFATAAGAFLTKTCNRRAQVQRGCTLSAKGYKQEFEPDKGREEADLGRWDSAFYHPRVLHYITGSGVKLSSKGDTGTFTGRSEGSSLVMGHNWLKCADVRGRCHILEGAVNHHRPLKCPMLHMCCISVASDSVKLPCQRRCLGVPTEPEQHILTHWTLCFMGFPQADQGCHHHLDQQASKLQESNLITASKDGLDNRTYYGKACTPLDTQSCSTWPPRRPSPSCSAGLGELKTPRPETLKNISLGDSDILAELK